MEKAGQILPLDVPNEEHHAKQNGPLEEGAATDGGNGKSVTKETHPSNEGDVGDGNTPTKDIQPSTEAGNGGNGKSCELPESIRVGKHTIYLSEDLRSTNIPQSPQTKARISASLKRKGRCDQKIYVFTDKDGKLWLADGYTRIMELIRLGLLNSLRETDLEFLDEITSFEEARPWIREHEIEHRILNKVGMARLVHDEYEANKKKRGGVKEANSGTRSLSTDKSVGLTFNISSTTVNEYVSWTKSIDKAAKALDPESTALDKRSSWLARA